MPARNKIVDLKKLLAERFPPTSPSRPTRLRTGLALFDQATEGGLAQGAITEIISPHFSAGSASLVTGLIVSARDRTLTALPYPVALIDGRDSFDPCPTHKSRCRSFDHLLWIRCRQAIEAIKAADLLLRDGNFPLVILDLILNATDELRKIPQSSWYRLQRLVEPISTAVLVLSRRSMVASAQLKLTLAHVWRLPDLERQDALAHLQFRLQRSHLRSTEQSEAQVV